MLDIKVLGTGCVNCIKLENLVKEVITENDLPANVKKITDSEKFMDYGVMITPGWLLTEKFLQWEKFQLNQH